METLITAVTDGQKKQVKRFVEDAVDRAIVEGLLDKDSIQKLIENGDGFQADIAASIKKHLFPNQFVDEEVESIYGYLSGYKPKEIMEQVHILRQFFPDIGFADEKLAERPLPPNAEGWFAIPRWQSVAKTYNEAVQKVLDLIKQQRKGNFYNYCEGKIGEQYLRQLERTSRKLEALGKAQKGYDILVVAAQFGLRYRGCSVRRAREVFMGNEFGLGVFEIGCMILTHPERLANYDDLRIDCAGSESSFGGDNSFLRALLFKFNDGKVEFGASWVDIANGGYGSASGFLSR